MKSAKVSEVTQPTPQVDFSKVQAVYNNTKGAAALASGTGSTILTSGLGDLTQANTDKKKLLGE